MRQGKSWNNILTNKLNKQIICFYVNKCENITEIMLYCKIAKFKVCGRSLKICILHFDICTWEFKDNFKLIFYLKINLWAFKIKYLQIWSAICILKCMYTISVKKKEKIITVINQNYAYLLHYLFIGKLCTRKYFCNPTVIWKYIY